MGRSGRDRREDMGADRLIDRALGLTRELFSVLQSAERVIDDTVRDLRAASSVERRAEGLERKAEAIEREALGDLTGTTERRERGRRGRSGDWREG